MTGESRRRAPREKIIRRWVLTGTLLLLLTGFYSGPVLRRYEIRTENPGVTHLRIALLSDLHADSYGRGQELIVKKLEKQDPDIVVMTGDMFSDGGSDAPVEDLLAALDSRYLCYYVTGNHDYWAGTETLKEKQALLEQYGVVVLDSEMMRLEIGGSRIDLCGVTDPNRYRYAEDDPEWETFDEALLQLSAQTEDGVYSILLSHRPEYFTFYEALDFDLVLAGHAHGGQWRIPFLLNGLYSPGEGVFPEYAGGRYDSDDMTMIVSRGLTRVSKGIPRFFNPTEVVIIDLIGPEKG